MIQSSSCVAQMKHKTHRQSRNVGFYKTGIYGALQWHLNCILHTHAHTPDGKSWTTFGTCVVEAPQVCISKLVHEGTHEFYDSAMIKGVALSIHQQKFAYLIVRRLSGVVGSAAASNWTEGLGLFWMASLLPPTTKDHEVTLNWLYSCESGLIQGKLHLQLQPQATQHRTNGSRNLNTSFRFKHIHANKLQWQILCWTLQEHRYKIHTFQETYCDSKIQQDTVKHCCSAVQVKLLTIN